MMRNNNYFQFQKLKRAKNFCSVAVPLLKAVWVIIYLLRSMKDNASILVGSWSKFMRFGSK